MKIRECIFKAENEMNIITAIFFFLWPGLMKNQINKQDSGIRTDRLLHLHIVPSSSYLEDLFLSFVLDVLFGKELL